MKNKVDFKDMLIKYIAIIMLFSMALIYVSYAEYRTYQRNYNEKINSIVSFVTDRYPDISQEEIVSIINSDKASKDMLSDYGMDIENGVVLDNNENCYKRYVIINIAILLCMLIAGIICVMLYQNKRNKKLNQITKYIDEINNRNYYLDISDNTEDELSILKNSLYKTTVMLIENADEALKAKVNLKESISDISHQLRTPLTSISITLENMLDDENMDMETKRYFLIRMRKEISNTSFLVENLLKLAKFDSNTVVFNNSEVGLESIISTAIENVAVLCELKNILISVEMEGEIYINCDYSWQTEAVTNILKNCVEHSCENSQIKIRAIQSKMYSMIEISDCGKGIAKEDIPHIFERFYKGKNSSTESVGIGLALAKYIVEENNGHIEVTSEQGKGTIFRIKYMIW